MLIRCMACKKLFYVDDTPRDNECPACGSANTDEIAMSFVFGRSASDADATVQPRPPAPLPLQR